MSDSTELSTPAAERMRKAKKYLRYFTMDTPELNRLIRGKEIDDDRLEFSILMTLSDWNTTTPLLTKVDITNFPSLYLLMHGGAIQCLKMAGLYQSRNELTYSSGGSSFLRSNKTAYYQRWVSLFAAEYESKKLNYKIFQNVAGGFGDGFSSEYSLIGFDF